MAELPTVKVAAAAFAFCTTGVPGVALELRELMTTLVPFRLRAPVLLAPKLMAFSEPAVLLSAPALPSCSMPALIATPPVKVFAPERTALPSPILLSPFVAVPEMTPVKLTVPLVAAVRRKLVLLPEARAIFPEKVEVSEVLPPSVLVLLAATP